MLCSTLLLLFALGIIVSATPFPMHQESASIPLLRSDHSSRGAANLIAQTIHAVNRRHGPSRPAIAPETLDAGLGFWYGNFTVGATPDLSLLIDTGSSDVSVNSGVYIGTSRSENLHDKNGTLHYVTAQPNGCGKAEISYVEYKDSMSFAGLEATDQVFTEVVPTPPRDNGTVTVWWHDGVIGFGGLDHSEIRETPFFTNLCNQRAVSECRFGLAYRTDGTGEHVLGALDRSLYTGRLSIAPLETQWVLAGDLALNGKVFARDLYIWTDSGTANVVGPPDQVQALFDAAGIQGVTLYLPGCTSVLVGYYPCSEVPKIGFGFPSISNATNATGAASKTSTIFNIETSAFMAADNGNGNCTAIISGIDFGDGSWTVGQAWFQGKYVDHNVDENTMGFAKLKHKGRRY